MIDSPSVQYKVSVLNCQDGNFTKIICSQRIVECVVLSVAPITKENPTPTVTVSLSSGGEVTYKCYCPNVLDDKIGRKIHLLVGNYTLDMIVLGFFDVESGNVVSLTEDRQFIKVYEQWHNKLKFKLLKERLKLAFKKPTVKLATGAMGLGLFGIGLAQGFGAPAIVVLTLMFAGICRLAYWGFSGLVSAAYNLEMIHTEVSQGLCYMLERASERNLQGDGTN